MCKYKRWFLFNLNHPTVYTLHSIQSGYLRYDWKSLDKANIGQKRTIQVWWFAIGMPVVNLHSATSVHIWLENTLQERFQSTHSAVSSLFDQRSISKPNKQKSVFVRALFCHNWCICICVCYISHNTIDPSISISYKYRCFWMDNSEVHQFITIDYYKVSIRFPSSSYYYCCCCRCCCDIAFPFQTI